MIARLMVLVRELLRGKALDRHAVAQRLGITLGAADRLLRELISYWPELVEDRSGPCRTLRWAPPTASLVGNSVAVATCFGASLSRILEGSSYASGLREARLQIVQRVRQPDLFKHFDRKFYFVPRGGEMMLPASAGVLDEVVDAVLRQNVLAIEYRRFDGKGENLRIEPLTIAVCDHQLYVIARTGEGTFHPYRFARVVTAEREEATFSYPTQSEYDPDQIFEDSFGVFLGADHAVHDVQVKLTGRWSNYPHFHRWHRSQRVTRCADGVIVHLRARVCPELKAWILGFGEDAEVLAPAELRAEIARRLEEAASRYARAKALRLARGATAKRGKNAAR
jgi:predicted DNA-binding transcriptional regulator YafY